MKKRVAFVMAGMMMMAGVSSAFAAADSTSTTDTTPTATVRFAEIKMELKDSLHQLNAEREIRLNTKEQILQKEDQILDLAAAAKQAKNKEALKEAAALRDDIHAVKQELKPLWDAVHAHLQAFRQALKDRNGQEAEASLEKAIADFKLVNAKLAQESALLDQVIAILSN